MDRDQILIMNNFKRKPNGFTLLELMTVVALIGVIASVALPSFLEQVRKARRVDGINVLAECATQQERVYTIGNTYNLVDLCGFVDGGTYYSEGGHYVITVTNPGNIANGCVTDLAVDRNNCFTATATAVTTSTQGKDDDCRSFSLTHLGVKSALDKDGADSTNLCWRN